jgi:NADH-quinone oxidoreductase subunit E
VNQLMLTYPDEISAVLAKYPPEQKRAAVMPLLHLAQRERGFITRQTLLDISEITGASTSEVASIVGFYTLYHAEEDNGGPYRIQVCTDLPCALRGADEFLQNLCENIGIKVGETTPDGLISIEEVTCLAGCHHAPVFQLQGGGDLSYHEDQTVETALELVKDLRAKAGEGSR